MKRLQVIFSSVLISIVLLGCGFSTTPAQPPAATPDIAATANAAIQATQAAQASVQATVSSAVQQTQVSMPTQTPSATTVPGQQTDYYTLSEEELAALIDQSVNEAMAASQTAYDSTTQATSDGTVSDTEAQTIYVTATEAEALIEEVDAMIAAYTEIYGELAEASLALMTELESDLESISQDLATITDIAVQGAAAATQAVEQLTQAAQTASENINETKDQVKETVSGVKENIEKREKDILDIKPNEDIKTPDALVENLHKFADEFKKGFEDRKFSKDEINRLGQLNANLTAGLKNHGGPKLSGFADGLDGITRQVSRGEFSKAGKSFGGFEKSLPTRRK